MADQSPPLPFYVVEESVGANHDNKSQKSSVKEDKLTFQEFKRTDPNDANNTTKLKIQHIGTNGTTEELIKIISQFKKAASKLGWTTGVKKFDNFELLLEGQMLYRWERIVGNMNRTNESFQDCLYELIKYKYPKEDAFIIQQEHLRSVTKRRTISVADFAERLEDLNMYSTELPGNDDDQEPLSEADLTRILFKAMPKAWRDEFRKNNHSLAEQTFASLRQSMMVYEEILTPKFDNKQNNQSNNNNKRGSNNDNRQSSNNNSSRNNSNRRSNDNSRSSNRNNGNNRSNNNRNNRNNSNNNNNNRRTNPNDTCPVHGGHLWSECIFNPQSSNYRPRNNTSNGNSNGNNTNNRSNNNGRSSRGDSHHANSNNQNTDNRNNNNGNNNNNNNPQSADQHHFELVPDSGIEQDWSNDNFLFNTAVELEDSELEPDQPIAPVLQTISNDNVQTPTIDLVPSTVVSIDEIGGAKRFRPLVALFDSGGSDVMINRNALPKGSIEITDNQKNFTTTAGDLTSVSHVTLTKIFLPEFTRNRHIPSFQAYIFDDPNKKVAYDVIFGRNFLQNIGIQLDFKQSTTTWLDLSVPMRPHGYWHDTQRVRDVLTMDPASTNVSDSFVAAPIAAAKYEAANLEEVIASQHHLHTAQRNELYRIFLENKDLFSGKLGVYPHREFKLQLKPDAKPFHSKPYAVPRVHLDTFKAELDRLVDIGVLVPTGASTWAAGTFIIPKKDGTVRWVSDFRQLNKYIDRLQYPLPRVQEIVQQQRPYTFITKIDVSMQYYTFRLDAQSSEYCTIVTPFGKYRYTSLPMGVCQSSDFAQATMEEVLRGLDNVTIYIDDIKITHVKWDDHINCVKEVLSRLRLNGFTVNPTKCQWCVSETDFLGFWFTPTGPKPWRKKIDSIIAMSPPKNRTDVRAFCGAITFYRDMFRHRSTILAPITKLASKNVKFEWGPEQQTAFDQMKALISEDVLLRYPDPNQPFDIHPDASTYQLGSVIKQHGHPVAYYSRKLTKTQQNYSTIEKELLSIVETLRTFRSFLLGAPINIYTDHKNLTFNVDNTNSRVLRWRLFVEDFQPTFFYVPGPTNVEADGLSRTPLIAPLDGQEDLADESDLFFFESMLMYPDPDPNDHVFPLDYNIIAEHQTRDHELQQKLNVQPDLYQETVFQGINLICHLPQRNMTWKIVIPVTLLPQVIRWYHTVLGHVGIQRLYQTMSVHFYSPKLRDVIEGFVKTCDACQRFKLPGVQVGELPPKNLTAQPWDEVSVDLIGPWVIKIHGIEYEFLALTAVDPTTTLAEIIRIDSKTSAHVAMKFENEWLSRYPRPLRCIHDQGPEFTSLPFQHVLAINGIKDVPTTVANPQANAVNERLHQTVENALRTMLHTFQPQNQAEAANLVDNCLATAQYASRAAVHRVLNVSPGAMVFQRDMILPIPLIANFELIRQRRQAIVDDNSRRQNLRRHFHDYNVGDEVLIVDRNKNRPTLAPIASGPYVVQQSHVNGTVTILRAPNVYERINIRRLRPYHRHGG